MGGQGGGGGQTKARGKRSTQPRDDVFRDVSGEQSENEETEPKPGLGTASDLLRLEGDEAQPSNLRIEEVEDVAAET